MGSNFAFEMNSYYLLTISKSHRKHPANLKFPTLQLGEVISTTSPVSVYRVMSIQYGHAYSTVETAGAGLVASD